MASTTPNIGLTLPTGTEGWKRSVINGNFTILDTKIGAVGNTPLQTQINTLNSQISDLDNKTAEKTITKESYGSDTTLKFTFTSNRYTALVFKTDNMSGSAGIYAITYKASGVKTVDKLSGSTTLPTVDADGSINVVVHAWSKVTLMSDNIGYFS